MDVCAEWRRLKEVVLRGKPESGGCWEERGKNKPSLSEQSHLIKP